MMMTEDVSLIPDVWRNILIMGVCIINSGSVCTDISAYPLLRIWQANTPGIGSMNKVTGRCSLM